MSITNVKRKVFMAVSECDNNLVQCHGKTALVEGVWIAIRGKKYNELTFLNTVNNLLNYRI